MTYIWEHKDWPNFHWDNQALLPFIAKARFAQGKLLGQINSIGLQYSQESRAEIMIEETVENSAIEGVIINRDAVRSSVSRRLGIPTAGLSITDRTVEGLLDAMLDATDKFNQPLKAERLKGWQAALFPTGRSGALKITAGDWRGGDDPMQVVSGPIGKEKVHYEAPPPSRVPQEMKAFIHWWEKDSRSLDGLIRAGLAHYYFVTIHPFEDGNGRVARILTDMALAQDENNPKRYYSMSARIMKDRSKYYNVLEKAQKRGLDITPWLEWFLNCFVKAIGDSEGIIANVTAKARFWAEHAQITINERQRKVLNKLLNAEPKEFEGGLTTRKYVSITKVSRATAFREINDLLDKHLIKPRAGKGRSASYEIVKTPENLK